MDKVLQKALASFAGTNLWDTIRDKVILELASEYKDVSIPFRYGDEQLKGTDAYYAKVGAAQALDTLVKNINRLKKSKAVKVEDFE